MSKPPVLITAALPYINNLPHCGNIVGSHLPADILHRFYTAQGRDSVLVGGSDEHGAPAMMAAERLGIPTAELTERLHDAHRRIYEAMGIGYTNYSRTSSPEHHRMTGQFFDALDREGFIHQAVEAMYFSPEQGHFLTDRYVTGTCPQADCGYEEAYSDQCDGCRRPLEPGELVNPRSTNTGEALTVRAMPQLYFDLPRVRGDLGRWIKSQRDVWRPHVSGEASRWLADGLRSRSITRDLSWGIPVNHDGVQDQVFYVWFEAPIGYLSFTHELGSDAFAKYWLNSDAERIHVLGKDNIPFHTIFWPGMLMAHRDIQLPTNIVGLNYLTFEGQKFSKSKNIGVFAHHILTSDLHPDVLRAYLTTTIPEARDTDFKWSQMQAHVNSELIGKLGNFFNRTLSQIRKKFDGRVGGELSDLTDSDRFLMEDIASFPVQIGERLSRAEFREAYRQVMEFASVGNVYLERTAPWTAVREGRTEDARRSLNLALNLGRSLAIVAAPFLPRSMQELWSEQLNFEGEVGAPGRWDEASQVGISTDHQIGQPQRLYEGIDDARLASLRAEFSEAANIEDFL